MTNVPFGKLFLFNHKCTLLSFRNKDLLLSDKLSLDLRPLSDSQSHASSSVPANHHFECVLRCGEEGGEGKGVVEVRVTCVGRKDGQQAAAQAMLKVRGCPSH